MTLAAFLFWRVWTPGGGGQTVAMCLVQFFSTAHGHCTYTFTRMCVLCWLAGVDAVNVASIARVALRWFALLGEWRLARVVQNLIVWSA